MDNISKTISQYVENQFPGIYREEGQVLIDFITAYYEYLEESGQSINRDMFTIRDIDTTLEKFIIEFRKKYLDGLPFVGATDDRFLIKNIIDLYRIKGSDESIKLLIRLLFDEDATVYYPRLDVLRPSDSIWVDPKYVEVISSPRSVSFVNKEVFGSVSGSAAFVDAVVTKRSNNRLIDILYISDVKGEFVFGDIITNDGDLEDAPKVIGSLSSISIDTFTTDPGGNQLNDVFSIVSDFGKNGQAKVKELSNSTSSVDFSIADGGFGYTTDSDTVIQISDLMVLGDNIVRTFQDNEAVFQRVETIYIDYSAGNALDSFVTPGSVIQGVYSGNTAPVEGVVLDKGEEILNNISYYGIKVQLEQGDTFVREYDVSLNEETQYPIGSKIEEESSYTFEISSNTSFDVGETVYQQTLNEISANVFISEVYNFGVVESVTNTSIDVSNAFGNFTANLDLVGATSGAIATITDITNTFSGKNAVIISKVSNTEYIMEASGAFEDGKQITDEKNRVVSTVANTVTESIETLNIQGTTFSDFITANSYFEGVVLGQDDGAIKISSDNNVFVFAEGYSKLVDSDENSYTVDTIDTGSGASFEIGSITNTETILIDDQIIGSNNVLGISYTDMIIDSGAGSGIGYIESITVSSGGTGYSNTSVVTFSGGGYEDQNPYISAIATITTDGSGSITQVNILSEGEGYYSEPTISVADGAGAVLEPSMVFGYGFPDRVLADSNTIIADALSQEEITIGTISSLSSNFKGDGYTRSPVTNIINPKITSYLKRNQILTLNAPEVSGAFTVGETVNQANTLASGIIQEVNANELTVRNTSFREDFSVSAVNTITGVSSGASGEIIETEYINTEVMGLNADIISKVGEKNGVVSKVKIINSGFGYQDGEEVTLVNGDVQLKGVINIEKQGIEPGYWRTRSSHLNSEKKLHDNFYYQDFSYDVKSSINIERYREILLDIIHASGSKFFGSVVTSSEKDLSIGVQSSLSQV